MQHQSFILNDLNLRISNAPVRFFRLIFFFIVTQSSAVVASFLDKNNSTGLKIPTEITFVDMAGSEICSTSNAGTISYMISEQTTIRDLVYFVEEFRRQEKVLDLNLG